MAKIKWGLRLIQSSSHAWPKPGCYNFALGVVPRASGTSADGITVELLTRDNKKRSPRETCGRQGLLYTGEYVAPLIGIRN